MDDLLHNEIDIAYQRIKSQIIKTPLITSEIVNQQTNSNVFLD